MYSDLAPWFHLLTHPTDYADEAAFVTRVVDDVGDGDARTLLELGSGGGNNASHLKARFACTLTDLSPDDARAEPDAQSRVRAPRGRHADASARTHLRRRLHPRRDLVPDDRGRSPRGDRDRGRPRAAGRRRHPDAGRDDEIFQPETDTVATTARTGAASATSSGRMRPSRTRSTYVVDYADRRARSGRRGPGRPRPAHARALPASDLGATDRETRASSSSTRPSRTRTSSSTRRSSRAAAT